MSAVTAARRERLNEVTAARRERMNELTGGLVTSGARSLEVLVDCLDSVEERVAIAAAPIILDYGFRFQRALADDSIEERLNNLENLQIHAGPREGARP